MKTNYAKVSLSSAASVISTTGVPFIARLLSTLVLLLALLPSSAFAQLVTRVVDGDTIVVANVGTVRLIGVDTPETVDPRKTVEFFGKEASEFTRRMTQGQVVRLDYDIGRTDRYHRTLAYAYLPEGSFVNAEIVRQGYGHAYLKYPFKYLEQFRQYEQEAREAGRGLGGGADYIAVPPAADGHQHAAQADERVYVTKTGTKYHREGCRYLGRSAIPIALKDLGTHEPCSVCKPPKTATTPSVAPSARPPAGTAASGTQFPWRCEKPSLIGLLDWNRMSAEQRWDACQAAGTVVISGPRHLRRCDRPSVVGTLDWNRMSAEQRWTACEAAGTVPSDGSAGRVSTELANDGSPMKAPMNAPTQPARVTKSPAKASTQPATVGRCQATTKKGTQCSRNAQAGSNYCWQHQR